MPSPLEKIYPKEFLRRPHPLKARIRKLGILQRDLAELLICSEPALSQWLNSARTMPRSVERDLNEILEKLEVMGDE